MKFSARIGGLWILIFAAMMTSGCRYLTNRYYDFRDTFAIGGGVTAENPVTGVVPKSLGVYLEATDLLQFGAITHNGYTAECDMRGTFVGPESSTRFGLLWWQMLRKNEDYENACYRNQFKNKDFPWCERMESVGMRKYGRAAKELHYENWANYMTRGTWMLHRGWQYWEYVGAEAAICDPFLTHMGVMVRFGFDLSEVADFLVGWFGLDFIKHDDMNRDEYVIFRDNPDFLGLKLVPARSRRQMLPSAEDSAPMVEDETAPAPENNPPQPPAENGAEAN